MRSVWDSEKEEWFFSIVDVCGILTDQPDYDKARKYWNKLKQRLGEEGFEPVTNCNQLKLTAQDSKQRLTDVANAEGIFRIIQSIPNKKAEPFKQWMAQVAAEHCTLYVPTDCSEAYRHHCGFFWFGQYFGRNAGLGCPLRILDASRKAKGNWHHSKQRLVVVAMNNRCILNS